MTCKKEDQVDDGSQRSKGRGLSRWGAGSLFILRYLAVNRWREATHSSILAGESHGLQSMGSHRVRHDGSDLAHTHAQKEKDETKLKSVARL